MSDAELARAAASYFGGRHRAAHVLTCDHCTTEDGRVTPCPRHPDRREQQR